MSFLQALELVVGVLFIAAVFTQLVRPLWRGTPIFPLFRTEEGRLESELADVRQAKIEAKLQKQIEGERQDLEEHREEQTSGRL